MMCVHKPNNNSTRCLDIFQLLVKEWVIKTQIIERVSKTVCLASAEMNCSTLCLLFQIKTVSLTISVKKKQMENWHLVRKYLWTVLMSQTTVTNMRRLNFLNYYALIRLMSNHWRILYVFTDVKKITSYLNTIFSCNKVNLYKEKPKTIDRTNISNSFIRQSN